jgi:recombination protein RecR
MAGLDPAIYGAPVDARIKSGHDDLGDWAKVSELDTLIQLLAKLPGLGPRSARRAALYMVKRRESVLQPLAAAMAAAAAAIRPCPECGNLDTLAPCAICRDPERDPGTLCVVEDLADLWALERTGAFRGRYHVLGGTLSALDGIGPDELNIARLLARVAPGQEVILALNATVDGQTTAHYLADRLAECGARVSRLAHGVPIGGELDYLDEGTLTAALNARRSL